MNLFATKTLIKGCEGVQRDWKQVLDLIICQLCFYFYDNIQQSQFNWNSMSKIRKGLLGQGLQHLVAPHNISTVISDSSDYEIKSANLKLEKNSFLT